MFHIVRSNRLAINASNGRYGGRGKRNMPVLTIRLEEGGPV